MRKLPVTTMGILGTGLQEGLLLKPIRYQRAMDLYDAAIRQGPKHSAAWLAGAGLRSMSRRTRNPRDCLNP